MNKWTAISSMVISAIAVVGCLFILKHYKNVEK